VGSAALLALLLTAVSLSAQPPKADPAKPTVIKLPDGTFLWIGPTDGGEKVQLTPQEFQKLVEKADALKKELAARKPAPPSGCAVRGRVEKRGEQLVAALKLTYSFRTAQPNAAVSLGCKKAFLVSASLDGAKLPVLDTADDGLAVSVEAAGDHTLTLEVEAAVGARGAKEVGFDLGLPRAPITTLALDPPADGKRVTVATRTPDPAGKADVRRVAFDAKQLAAKSDGHPLGPVDSLEVTWDPPAAASAAADAIQSAELDVTATLSEGLVESTAKAKLRGPAREWRFVAPPTAEVTVERLSGTADAAQPVVTRPTDAAKLVWKIELPAGSSAADWAVSASARVARPKAGGKPGAAPIGPYAVLNVLQQTGTVKVTAGPYTRFVFKHGPDLRRVESPGPDDVSTALFRLATGPTGATAVNTPLLTAEAWPIEGAVRVKPTYKLRLTDAGWLVRAEIAVKPIRTEVDTLTIDVPADWRGLESESDPDTVEGVSPGKADGPWRPVTVRLAGGQKQPFTLAFAATVPAVPAARELTVGMPRYPKAVEREAAVTASVPDGWEVQGTARGWDGDQPAAWAAPLTAVPGADGRLPKVVAAVAGKGDRGLSRVSLTWQPHRPDVTAEVRAEVTVGERQLTVAQVIRLRSPDGFPRPVRLRGPADAAGLKSAPALDPVAPGVWSFAPPADARDAVVKLSYALPLPARPTVPVGLTWPADAARVGATVRVWAESVQGRAVTAAADGWRELPPDPSPDRDALPVLTLAASAEHPLALEVRPADAGAAAAVWVERTLIEAAPAEDGAVSYRARFRLGRWLTPAAELLLPDGAGEPAVQVDGLAALPADAGGGRYRIPLPDGAAGRAVVLDVRYTRPGARAAFGETTYHPPRVAAAAYAGPVRWLITEPTDSAPLLLSNRGRAELRWHPRGATVAPSAASRTALDRWFTAGADPADADVARAEGEPVAVRQASPEPIRVGRAPWLVLVAAASLAAFLLSLVTTWLPATASALLVTALGGGCAAAAVLYPQPAAQVAAAGLPGLAAGLFAAAAQAVVRRRVRRRVANLPGFTRTPAPPSAAGAPPAAPAGTPSARSRPGSGAPPAPVAPSGS
jgi:hypothetical protein